MLSLKRSGALRINVPLVEDFLVRSVACCDMVVNKYGLFSIGLAIVLNFLQEIPGTAPGGAAHR
jgi:hypothetical protein